MKDALKRAAQLLGLTQPVADAVTAPDDATLAAATVVVEAHDAAGNLEATSDTQAALTAALARIGELSASLTEVTAALSAVAAEKEKAEAAAALAKFEARKSAVVTALGTDRADAFMAATAAMPDAQFDTVMAAMSASSASEASKPEFTEVGVDAKADVDALVVEATQSGTGALLAAKYQKPASK